MRDNRPVKSGTQDIRAKLITQGLIKPNAAPTEFGACMARVAVDSDETCGVRVDRLKSRPWDIQCGNCMYPGLSKAGRDKRAAAQPIRAGYLPSANVRVLAAAFTGKKAS